jgi:hypothetical protein
MSMHQVHADFEGLGAKQAAPIVVEIKGNLSQVEYQPFKVELKTLIDKYHLQWREIRPAASKKKAKKKAKKK